MKKTAYLSFLTLLMSACSGEEPLIQQETTNPNSNPGSSVRSINEAVAIANSLADAFSAPNSRTPRKAASCTNAVQVISKQLSRSAAPDTLIYVVNYDNADGFALIAAPHNIDPLIGFVEEGEFASLETAENPGFQYFMDAAINYCATMSIKPGIDDNFQPLYTEIKFPVQDTIPSRLTVKWGQHLPEGKFCPNKTAGCAQTAMAQIMSAFDLPDKINLTYPERDIDLQNLNWKDIKCHQKSLNLSLENFEYTHLLRCPASKDAHEALGRLCRQLGYMNYATYNSTSTSAAVSDVQYNLTKLLSPTLQVGNFRNYYSDNDSILFMDLKQNPSKLLFMAGWDTTIKGGHGWVVDGGARVGYYAKRTYSVGQGIDGTGPRTETIYNISTLFHYNWGWNGNGNGYFKSNVFKPSNPESLDDPNNSTNKPYDLSENVCFFDISRP